MNTWTIVWLLVYAASALLFFGTAIVITVVGLRDLKDLLTHTTRTSSPAGQDRPERPS